MNMWDMMCDMTHSYVCVTWLIHVVTRLTCMFDMTHSWVCQNSFGCHDSFVRVVWLGSNRCDMGWLRLVDSLKLHVSFAEYRLFYRALLQKRHIILRSLLIEATPYDSAIFVTWLIVCVPWLIDVFGFVGMQQQWHETLKCVKWIIRVCTMTHLCVWYGWGSERQTEHEREGKRASEQVTCGEIWIRHITHPTRAYGVATISKLFKIITLFCKRALPKRRHSAKETYNFKEPTNRSHPMSNRVHTQPWWIVADIQGSFAENTGQFWHCKYL